MAIPRCVVFIPDGNRRWARSMGYEAIYGHTRGITRLNEVVNAALDCGVEHTAFWAASELNIKRRSEFEVAHLYDLLKKEIKKELQKAPKTRFRLVGNWYSIRPDEELLVLSRSLEQATQHISGRNLAILFGYSGKSEILAAMAELAASGEAVTDESVRRHLATGFLPDVDLFIRTGVLGDPHWSDSLLLWQISSAQFYFTETMWPEFDIDALYLALKDFEKRRRALGA